MVLVTGFDSSNERIALTIAVTGWFSAKTRTTVGIVSVGMNAELMKGRKISGYENALALAFIFFHALVLGREVGHSWFTIIWVVYGITLVAAWVYNYIQNKRKGDG